MRTEVTRFGDSSMHLTEHLSKHDRFVDTVIRFYRSYSKKTVLHALRKEQTTVCWHCYECKKEIDVNVSKFLQGKRFNPTELFCSDHKPVDYNILRTVLFVRWQDMFFKALSNKILDASIKQHT
jgi:hypothetical protein